MGYLYYIYTIYITIYNSHYLKCFIVTNRVINWSRISMDFFQPQKTVSFLRECMGQIQPHVIRDLVGQITSQWSVLLYRRRSKWSRLIQGFPWTWWFLVFRLITPSQFRSGATTLIMEKNAFLGELVGMNFIFVLEVNMLRRSIETVRVINSLRSLPLV